LNMSLMILTVQIWRYFVVLVVLDSFKMLHLSRLNKPMTIVVWKLWAYKFTSSSTLSENCIVDNLK
jgi:hypothetical protein